jgi:hypothetical protein
MRREHRTRTGGGDGVELDVGPRHPFVDGGTTGVTIVDGDDWSFPSWVRPAPNSGYFSEEADAAELVAVRSIDLSWRQLRPTPEQRIDRTSSGSAQGMSFDDIPTPPHLARGRRRSRRALRAACAR